MTMLRTLKRRFGIAAPRVAVHTHLPWHLRLLGFALGGILVILLAWVMYESGLKLAGYHSGRAAEEQARLSQEVSRLRDENADLRGKLAVAERRSQIEQSTQGNLTGQLKALSDENALLKEDLAFFQTLMTSGVAESATGVTVNRFRVQPDAMPGEFRYQLLIVQSRTRGKEFQGKLQLVVDLLKDGQAQVLMLPRTGDKAEAYALAFKFYQRVEGVFKVPPDTQVKRVQVRVLEEGVEAPRSTQTVNLS
jgi:hypothetical protein